MEEKDEDFTIDNESDLDDSVVAEEHAQDSVKKLKEKLKAAEEKAREHLDGWQRAQADFANLRKRDEAAKSEFLKFATENLVEQLIPVLDSFNIALSQGHKDAEPIYKQFLDVLKSNGLEELNPEVKEEFDPRVHEAIGTAHTDNEDEDGKVLDVAQKGYKLSGRVIRPAKVRVGEYIKG